MNSVISTKNNCFVFAYKTTKTSVLPAVWFKPDAQIKKKKLQKKEHFQSVMNVSTELQYMPSKYIIPADHKGKKEEKGRGEQWQP